MFARFLINVVALLAAVWLVGGIWLTGDTQHQVIAVAVVAVVFGIVNALIKPVLTVISLPFLILTLGLFAIVINAAMLKLTGWVAGQVGLGFHVGSWGSAAWGAVIVGVASWLAGLVFKGDGHSRR
ncbi:phage holin family protein [Aestuariimicrobium kwangyangense]|uniref:phage holin family protein n=1 Tax=Aestuariimicrobium kwangyangense TaxID=396389 RepID=UPI0003B4DEDE|nr:phage holin family protein [Aestuariimicrobium kwangyangense]